MRFFVIFFLLVLPCVAKAQHQLPMGSKAPVINATSYDGREVRMDELLEKGPIIVNFTRGEWCKHCIFQLGHIEDSLSYLQQFGATVIGVTPESEEHIQTTVDKTKASFFIIYDADRTIMQGFQVQWKMSRIMHFIYRLGGININKASNRDDRMLPVPATYIIDRDGRIAGSFYDEDHTKRMTVAEMISILESIQ